MESILINNMQQAIHRASKFLLRDYYELELQQSSKSINKDFLQKSYEKCGERLSGELAKYSEQYNFKIVPIDSMLTFSRSLPYFGIVVIAFEKGDEESPIASIVEFPILGETFYAERSKGAWLRRYNNPNSGIVKLGASNREKDLVIVSKDDPSDSTIVKERIELNSDAYSVCLFCSGKVDYVKILNPTENISLITNLFVQESRGKIISDNPLILTNGCSSIGL